MYRRFVCIGALSAAMCVVLGAFAAHALKLRIPQEMLAVFQTGVQYQFYHSLGLILIGILIQINGPSKALAFSGWLMLAGIVFFSGSLYAIVITGIRGLGMITPIGGVAFIVAWLLLSVDAMRRSLSPSIIPRDDS